MKNGPSEEIGGVSGPTAVAGDLHQHSATRMPAASSCSSSTPQIFRQCRKNIFVGEHLCQADHSGKVGLRIPTTELHAQFFRQRRKNLLPIARSLVMAARSRSRWRRRAVRRVRRRVIVSRGWGPGQSPAGGAPEIEGSCPRGTGGVSGPNTEAIIAGNRENNSRKGGLGGGFFGRASGRTRGGVDGVDGDAPEAGGWGGLGHGDAAGQIGSARLRDPPVVSFPGRVAVADGRPSCWEIPRPSRWARAGWSRSCGGIRLTGYAWAGSEGGVRRA